jgi:uncharacterized cupredoxin-like copper-binding protein
MKNILFFLMLAISLTLSACGSSPAKPTTKLDVTMTDFQFTPNQFMVPAGKEITLNIADTGVVVHNFVIMKFGHSVGTEFADDDTPNVYWEVEIQPGGSTNTSFTAPKEPGEYEVVCKTPGHLQVGMIAKLIVVENK